MRIRLFAILLVATACGGGGGGGNGDTSSFVALWQYQEGSFSFVNCYVLSRTVDLARTGFQIANEAGTLVRTNPDGCRFTIVPSTATHADGIHGETCTVTAAGTTTRYELDSLVMDLEPADQSQMIEVFRLESEQTSSLGTYTCEITGNNTLDRAP